MLQSHETADKIIVSLKVDRVLYDSEIQEASDRLKTICQQAATNSKRLVIDLGGVKFMSSPLLGQLIIIEKLAKTASVDLRLANVSGQCLELFTLLRVDKLFRFEDGDDGPKTQTD